MTQFTIAGTTYDLVESPTFAEARAIEKRTGHTFDAIKRDKALRKSVDVVQALLWVSMKRKEPTLTFGDLDDIEIGAIEWHTDETAEEEEGSPDPSEGEASSDDA